MNQWRQFRFLWRRTLLVLLSWLILRLKGTVHLLKEKRTQHMAIKQKSIEINWGCLVLVRFVRERLEYDTVPILTWVGWNRWHISDMIIACKWSQRIWATTNLPDLTLLVWYFPFPKVGYFSSLEDNKFQSLYTAFWVVRQIIIHFLPKKWHPTQARDAVLREQEVRGKLVNRQRFDSDAPWFLGFHDVYTFFGVIEIFPDWKTWQLHRKPRCLPTFWFSDGWLKHHPRVLIGFDEIGNLLKCIICSSFLVNYSDLTWHAKRCF